MNDIRKIIDILEDISTEPEIGDAVDMEFGDLLIETSIEDITEDGVVIKLDETALSLILDVVQLKKNPFVYETNRKIKCVLENKFPKLPTPDVFSNRIVEGAEQTEWHQFKQQLKEYKFNYKNIKEDYGLRKLPKINKLIQESYSEKNKSSVPSYIKTIANNSIAPDKLKIGQIYDVLVMFVDNASKTIDLDVHNRQKIKKIKKIASTNEYEVFTDSGLRGKASKNFVDDIEVLYFNDLNRLRNSMLWAKLKDDTDGEWKISINTEESFKENLDESDTDRMRGEEFEKKADELHRKISAARMSGDKALEKKLQQQYDDLYDEAKKGLVAEAEYQGRKVPLGKPMKGDVKKSKVYVKNAKGTVVKVNFGDKKMRIKKSNPARRKSFRARHNCANPGPRWKAKYWSCRAW